jgi:hypothetical protein
MPIQLRRLTPRDLPQVAALEASVFPPQYQLGLPKHRELMAVPYFKGCNFSVGAFNRDQLVGHLLMYVESSMFNPNEHAARWRSLAVLPAYRFQLTSLLVKATAGDAVRCGYSIEAECRESTGFRLVQSHPRVVMKLGGQVTRMLERPPCEGERITAIRIDPVLSPQVATHRPGHWLVTRIERWRNVIPVLPLRTLRRVCYLLPRRAVPRALLRYTLLEQY